MIKNYILGQLSQMSFWIGAGVIASAILMPRSIILFLGILLVIVPDNALKKKFEDWAPAVKRALHEIGE